MDYLFPKHPLLPVTRDEEGGWVFFDGSFKIYTIKKDNNEFVSRHVFAKGSPHTDAGRKSTATPPYHWHIYQAETFDVKRGRMCYLLEGKEGKVEVGNSVTIPPGLSHTFWSDPDCPDGLDVHITVRDGPTNSGLDDRFFHNLFGYIDSVRRQGLRPAPLQMLVFGEQADVVMADVPLGAGRVVNAIGRVLGRYVAGYQPSYKIFEED